MKTLFTLLIIMIATPARADDARCMAFAKSRLENTKVELAYYWNGATLTPLPVKQVKPGETIYYFQRKKEPTAANLTIDKIETNKIRTEQTPECEGGLGSYTVKRTTTTPTTPPVTPPAPTANATDDLKTDIEAQIKGYRDARVGAIANGSSVTGELVQILGQIVVDRASQRAYSLITKRLKRWLRCGVAEPADPADPTGLRSYLVFDETCRLLDDLRLQDLTMVPDRLRAALIQDGLASVRNAYRRVPTRLASVDSIGSLRVVLAPDSENGTKELDCTAAYPVGSPEDIRCTIQVAAEKRIAPLLARLPSSINGHEIDLYVRQLIDKGLSRLEQTGADKFCDLKGRQRIMATVGVAFAACQASNADQCSIMDVVHKFDAKCESTKRLDPARLAYAQSIAGHLWDAVTLIKNSASDHEKRLVAGIEGSFEIGCMYAVNDDNFETKIAAAATTTTEAPSLSTVPYRCEILDAANLRAQPLTSSEALAIARDLMLAGAQRDGTALAAVAARTITRLTSKEDDKKKGVRLLSTITAYAATYGGNGDPKDAHDRRTALLESLTKDMTERTDRDGDKITSLGGSLRIVAAWRIGRKRREAGDANNTFHDDAAAAPLALPLGFAVDRVETSKHWGRHLEVGILDLGQYLSLNKDWKLAEPDVIQAFSPSITYGVSWGKELPCFLGATAGYTPGFDFDENNDKDKKGAWHIGATFGIYVPLFDFN